MAYIKSININLFDGKFNQIINFGSNLNILSGVNGTGKTKVLQLLKQGTNVIIEPPSIHFNQLKVIALSPKRNAEKRAIENLVSYIRNTDLLRKTQELLTKQIRDETYDSYSSFVELFYLKFEELRSKHFGSKTQQEILDEFIKNINEEVIRCILPNYKLETTWNYEKSFLDPKIYKESAKKYVNLENLSTGEQEILSLLFNIYILKDEVDIFIIDEPEIHLNWTLEKNLFNFLEEFSIKYQKQVIVSTHSRIIFDKKFQKYIKYLIWEDGVIKVKDKVPSEYREQIAGESLALLSFIQPEKRTLFVEDDEQEITIKALLKAYGKDENLIEIIKLSGGSGTLENLYKIITQNPELILSWTNAYFLKDSDLKSHQSRDRFITLKKYSIESYYMNFEVLSSLLNKDKENIKEEILKLIKEKKRKIVGDGRNAYFFEKLIDKLYDITQDQLDVLDCSQFFNDFLETFHYKKTDFMEKYIQKAKELGKLEEIFDHELINFIKSN
jgi:energy-coupling factor transporter ATP-binding protein EcfA2